MQHRGEALVCHSLVAQVQLADGIYFLVGIVGKRELVGKPGVAHSVGIKERCGRAVLHRKDEVACVEHIQDRENAVALHLRHISFCLHNALHGLLHLRRDVAFYHLLIAAELGGVVASDALVVIGGFVFVERIAGKVEHSVVESLVLEYLFVGLSELLRCVALALGNEHIVVEVAFVNHPHIYEAQHQYSPYHIACLQLACAVAKQQHRAYEDYAHGAPTVCGEYLLAQVCEVGKQRIEILRWELAESLALGRRYEIEESTRHQRKQRSHSSRQCEADV